MFNIKWGGIAAGTAFVLAITLSLLLGQTSFLIALFRGAIFAALFFGLGLAAWTLINSFIPELLSSPNTGGGDIATNLFATGNAGSRVNITVDDEQDTALSAALPEQEYGASGGGEVGDINNLYLPKNDVDQTPATEYTEGEQSGDFAPIDEFASTAGGLSAVSGEFTSAFGDDDIDDGLGGGLGAGDGEGAEGAGEEKSGEFSMDFSAFVPGGLDGGESDGETEDTDSEDPFSFFGGGDSAAYNEPAVPERKVSRNKPMKLEGDFDAREIAAGLRTVLEKDKK